jgi:hypothetical protein
MGELMIVLDTTIVNVALPSIREDLGFTATSLAWVVNEAERARAMGFFGFVAAGGGALGVLLALNPLLLAAMGEVEQSDDGLAPGIVNTSFMMGLGLAVLASVASSRTDALLAAGQGRASALVGGYHVAFIVGAGSPRLPR